MLPPLHEASLKIGYQTRGGLVPVFSVFGKKLHDDGGQLLGYRAAIRGRYGLTRDVAVNPFQRIGSSEWKRAGKHLVQGDAQRVEIAASIDRAIHAPGLFRGHVGEGARNGLGRGRRLALARQPGRDAKAGEPYLIRAVGKYVLRLDVFVDQPALVSVAERRCQVSGKAQKMHQIERLLLALLKNAVERLAARVGENQDCPPFLTRERQRLGSPRGLQFGGERVFVLEAS